MPGRQCFTSSGWSTYSEYVAVGYREKVPRAFSSNRIVGTNGKTVMPQAVVDPEELREFARSLKKFNNDLRDRARSLSNQLTALGSSWRDQEHVKFVQQFEEGMRMISRFLENNDRHVPYLLRKAEAIDEYLRS